MKHKVTATKALTLKGFGLKKTLAEDESAVMNEDDWDTYSAHARRLISSGALRYEAVGDETAASDVTSTGDLKAKHNALVEDLDGDTGVTDKDHKAKHKV